MNNNEDNKKDTHNKTTIFGNSENGLKAQRTFNTFSKIENKYNKIVKKTKQNIKKSINNAANMDHLDLNSGDDIDF